MKSRMILLIYIISLLIGCKVENDNLLPINVSVEISNPSSINVKQLGIKTEDNIDDSKAIQSLIKSNAVLFFPKGTYDLNNYININSVTNLKIYGESGTIFRTNQNKVLQLNGNIKNVEIQQIKFLSTKNSNINDPEGLIFIANYGANDLMDGISIHDCQFSNPYTHANGIKLVSEGANSMVKNISIVKNIFASIGRFAVEFQNHNRQTIVARFRDYEISGNYFYDVGTIQDWPAPCCISVSGYALNGKINSNMISDMRMKTSPCVYYGIENAGTIGLETIGNHMRSTTYGFTGIIGSGPSKALSDSTGQPLVRNWTINNNSFDLVGSTTDKTKIRGMDIADVNYYTITNNTITSDDIAIRLSNCSNGNITSNVVKVNLSGYGFYFQNGSRGNSVTFNKLDCSQGIDSGVIFFIGSNTTGNKAIDNIMLKTGGLPGRYVNYNGASNNF